MINQSVGDCMFINVWNIIQTDISSLNSFQLISQFPESYVIQAIIYIIIGMESPIKKPNAVRPSENYKLQSTIWSNPMQVQHDNIFLIPRDLTSMVSCQKGPTRHAYAWQIGPF